MTPNIAPINRMFAPAGGLHPRPPVMRRTAVARNTAARAARELGEQRRSLHLGQQPLLSPRRRAGVEEWRAGVQQTQIMRSEDALSLIPVLEHINAMFMCDRCAHEVAGALVKLVFALFVPPLLDASRDPGRANRRPEFIATFLSSGLSLGPLSKSLGRASDPSQAAPRSVPVIRLNASPARRAVSSLPICAISHGTYHGITDDAAALNEPRLPAFDVGELLEGIVRLSQFHRLQCEPKGASAMSAGSERSLGQGVQCDPAVAEQDRRPPGPESSLWLVAFDCGGADRSHIDQIRVGRRPEIPVRALPAAGSRSASVSALPGD